MAILVNPPLVVFEDEHLLVVNKPAGWNTHSPAPHAGEGIYEWLKNREPRWASLAIVHRLDKETSGLLIFTKTPEANKSLTQQFTDGTIRKEYALRSAKAAPKNKFTVRSTLKRVGDRYMSQRGSVSGVEAETEFEVIGDEIIARPKTGRTHQIRVHASESGFPILGDALYGGAPHPRLMLHARRIEFTHPIGCGTNLECPQGVALCDGLFVPSETNAYRTIHTADWQVDRFGDYLLSQSPESAPPASLSGNVYHKVTTSHVRGKTAADASPRLVTGLAVDGPFVVRENGVQYEINFNEGYSVGIFLDQRDNRRRLLTGYVAPDFLLPLKKKEVLNTFAYTCAFSVCAALAGARVTSLDLSRKYLDWGRRNFQLNAINPEEHDFIYGDVFDWMKRLSKKNRQFDLILLDPPTFSKSKQSGLFRAETDYPRLVMDALKLLRPNGVLFASSNAARWEPQAFLDSAAAAIRSTGRKVLRQQYVPQPPDFPISREAPAYLKTAWFQVG